MIHLLSNYTGVILRMITLWIMFFLVIPKQIEAFQLKDDFKVLKLMLLIVSGVVIGSTFTYLYLWLGRFGVFSIHPDLYDALIVFTASTGLVISVTLALIYHHRYLQKGKDEKPQN